MKSKTSFFSAAVLKKDITRFAPLWAVYTLIFALVCIFTGYDEPARYAENVAQLCRSMPLIICLYAIVTAMMVFSDLYRTQTAYTLLAMPLRREGHYITHTVSGLLMGIVPHIAMMPVLFYMTRGEGSMMPFIWLLDTVLCFVLFFGIAAFSCQLAGSKLGAFLIYMAVNFFCALLYSFINIFYIPVLGGIRINEELLISGSPAARLSQLEMVDCFYRAEFVDYGFHYNGLVKETWIYLTICVIIGLLVWGFGLWFCRRRKAEAAGDLVAVKKIAPVFLAVYTMVCGEFIYYVAEIFAGTDTIVFLIVGMTVGFFTGLMLLKRTVKVFTGKTFIAFGVTALALYVSFVAIKLDPLGRVTYVPGPDEVESVLLMDYYSSYPRYNNIITNREDIKKITDAHKALIDVSAKQGGDFSVYYRLKNGTTIVRTYNSFDVSDEECKRKLDMAFSIPEVFFRAEDIEAFFDNIWWVEVRKDFNYYTYVVDEESGIRISSSENQDSVIYNSQGKWHTFYKDTLNELWKAILADSAEGHLHHSQKGPEDVFYMDIYGKDKEQNVVVIYDEAVHTKTYIESLYEMVKQ